MNAVTTEDLTAHLSDFLNRAARGEEFLVTDQGKPVARIIPAIAPDIRQQVRDMLTYRDQQQRTLGGVSIQDLRDEGRRY